MTLRGFALCLECQRHDDALTRPSLHAAIPGRNSDLGCTLFHIMHLHPCTGSLQSASRRGRSQIGRGEQLGTVVFPC